MASPCILGALFHVEGLRRVRPYAYNFETHAKERWLGRTVIDVFSESRAPDVGILAAHRIVPFFLRRDDLQATSAFFLRLRPRDDIL